MEALAKPSGITLREHRQHVFDEALRLVRSDAYRTATSKYSRFTGRDLLHDVKRAAWWHDVGKEHRDWKRACRADHDEYRAWRTAAGLDPDQVNAADYDRYEKELRKQGKQAGQHLQRAGIRHEFHSLWLAAKKVDLSLAEQAAIAAHHGKLANRYEHRWHKDGDGYTEFWKNFRRESDLITQPGQSDAWKQRALARYHFSGVRALLQLADTRASRAEAGGWLPPLDAFSYDFRHPTRRGVQKTVLQHAGDWITILRAPTGSGKTDAALLWAQYQVENGRADRLVITLPTRFTSNALAVNVARDISGTGLYHSSAWHVRYGDGNRPDQLSRDNALELHRMARLLATPATVCTLDHLLIALTGTKEDHHSIFFHLAHSAVVIDEADFYDPFVQANLTVLLDTLRLLEVPVLIMSATVPESARELYGVEEEIAEATADEAEPARSLVWVGDAEQPEDAAAVLEEMWQTGTGIVYANTVARALAYYRWFQRRKGESDGTPVILYHSRFTEPHKKNKEEALLAALGKDAWDPKKPGTARGIAVLTQIGEMSVNISAPLMLSDLCPWDRLAQRAGRLNRFGVHQAATLYIVRPIKKGEPYPAPYGSPLSSGKWEAHPALHNTEQRLLEMLTTDDPYPITAADFVHEVNQLYPEPEIFDSKAAYNRDELLDLMRRNWLIVPKRGSNEETGTVPGEWRSRDIDRQVRVFVGLPEDVLAERGDPDATAFPFRSYGELRGFELECSVTCPLYLVKNVQRREMGEITDRKFTVGDDREEHPYYYTDHYDAECGLTLGLEQQSGSALFSDEPDDW